MGSRKAKVVVFGLLLVLSAFSFRLELPAAQAQTAAVPQGCPEHQLPTHAPEPVAHLCCAAGHQAALPTILQPQHELQISLYVPLAQRFVLQSNAPLQSFSSESPGPPLLTFALRV
jgi:hypothetical protein